MSRTIAATPEIRNYLTETVNLVKRIIAVWDALDEPTRTEVTHELAKAGVERRNGGWCYSKNRQTFVVN